MLASIVFCERSEYSCRGCTENTSCCPVTGVKKDSMDTSLLLSYAGELSGLLVSGALLLTASAAIKASRKRNREEDDDDENDENNNGKAKQSGDLSGGEEDSISAEWRQLHKLLKEKLQIDLVHKTSAAEDDKYVRLNFSSRLPPSPKADDESRLIKALAEAGIKVLGSEG